MVTAASHTPPSAVCVMSPAHVKLGASVSRIVTSNEHAVTFQWMSVTVHVTVVVPGG